LFAAPSDERAAVIEMHVDEAKPDSCELLGEHHGVKSYIRLAFSTISARGLVL